MTKEMKTTGELQTELEAIVAWFESDEADIDKAQSQYERGLEIAKQLEDRLSQTKNNITKLKQTFES